MVYLVNMTNPWENNYNTDDGGSEASEEREQFELWENILNLDLIIVRLSRLLATQSELFSEEIEILDSLLKIVEKYKVILDPSVKQEQLATLKHFEKSEIKSDLPDDANLDKEIYAEINIQISTGQQILDAEQIVKCCARLMLSKIIEEEDKEIITKAIKILQNFRKVLQS